MDKFPPESLCHIFAQLPLTQINNCSLVNRHWHDIIKHEATWLAAFQNHFNIHTHSYYQSASDTTNCETQNRLLLTDARRIDLTSWRNEYRSRLFLLSKWQKSRIGMTRHRPLTPEKIHSAHIKSSNQEILVACLSTGQARKIYTLESNPSSSAPPEIDPLVSVSRPVCLGFSSDGQTIAWGLANGQIWLRGCTHHQRVGALGDLTGPGSTELAKCHLNEITCLKFVDIELSASTTQASSSSINMATTATFLISCCKNGLLKLWRTKNTGDKRNLRLLWTFQLQDDDHGGLPDIGTSATVSRDGNTLGVGTGKGHVHLWNHFRALIIDRHEDRIQHIVYRPDFYSRKEKPIEKIVFVDDSNQSASILIHWKDSETFERLWVPAELFTDQIYHYLKYGAQDFGPISSFDHYERLVVGGDRNGKTCVWDCSACDEFGIPSRLISGGASRISGISFKPPLFCLRKADVEPITSIKITPLLIAVGSDDGLTRIYDCLTGDFLRLLKDKETTRDRSRMISTTAMDRHPDEDGTISGQFRVRQLSVGDRGQVIVVSGEAVMVWELGGGRSNKKEESRKVLGRTVSKSNAFTSFRELREEILDTQESIEFERSGRRRQERAIIRLEGEFGHTMNAEEALQYALMLSREEEEEEIARRSMMRLEEGLDAFPAHQNLTPSSSNRIVSGEDSKKLACSSSNLGQLTTSIRSSASSNAARNTSANIASDDEWPRIGANARSHQTQSQKAGISMMTSSPWKKIEISDVVPTRILDIPDHGNEIDDELLRLGIELSLVDASAHLEQF